jgi:hypothetical protein
MMRKKTASINLRLAGRRVLIAYEGSEDSLAATLRGYGIQVTTSNTLAEAELLWAPGMFDFVFVDARRRSPKALALCRLLSSYGEEQKVYFLVGAPDYITFYWPPIPKNSPAKLLRAIIDPKQSLTEGRSKLLRAS